MGRILVTLLLVSAGVLREPLRSLSLYRKQNRARYDARLDRVRTEGGAAEWLERFLEGVRATAASAAETARRLVELPIARELTGKRRNRLFAYDRDPTLRSEGMEANPA